MKKTRKLLIFVLSIMFAISAFGLVACSQKKEEMKITTVPPVVQHRVGESINLYDYIVREAGATYTFTVSCNGGEAKTLGANGYYLAETGNYTFTVTGSTATAEGSATFSLSVVEVAPTIWYTTSEIPSYWLEYTILYKLLDEGGPYTMPVGGVTTEFSHVFVYPAEDDTVGYKIDLTGKQSYVEKFNTATPDDLTIIELTDENVDELGFYVNRKKRVDDTSPIKADDGKYYGVEDMQGIFMYLMEGKYEFHYKSYNTGGEKTGKFYVSCTEKLFELTEIEGALTFDRDTEMASWAPVEGAVKYKVKILNKNFYTTDCFFDCSQLITNPIMDYTIVVLPIGENQEKANDYLNGSKMTYETPYLGSEGTVLNEDKSITISGTNPIGGELYGHLSAVENDYYAIRGSYDIGTYIDVTFVGNNMPTIVLFADAINGTVTWHGGNGLVVMNGLVAYSEGGDIVKNYQDRTYVFGPNRMSTHYTHKPLANITDTNLTQNYLKANPSTKFKYTVGTRLDSGDKILLSSTLTNVTTGEVISTKEFPLHYQYDASKAIMNVSPTRYLTSEDVNAGSILLYGAYKLNGEDTTILSVSDPYYQDPRSTIENEDGSYTVTANRVVGTGWTALQSSNSQFGYVLHEGKYGVNTYAEFVFKGNNMPQVILFADNIDGNFTGAGGGKGILISNGSVTYTTANGEYVENTDTSSLKIYGPNRMAGDPAFVEEDSKFSQDYLSRSSRIEYRYVVGTKVVYEDVNTYEPYKKSYIGQDGFMEEVIYVVLELYNNSTGKLIDKIETPLLSTTNEYDKLARNKYVTVQDVTSGSILALAGIKGVDKDGEALSTTFFCSEPETIEPTSSGHVHDFTNYNNDGTYHWYECSCGAKCTKGTCAGGTATCSALAVCDVCGLGHGELIPHVGGTATCTEKATCQVCGQAYGYYGHEFNVETSNVQSDDNYHWFTCAKCGVVTEQMIHTGGEATYEDRAACEICGKPHGDYKVPESSDEVTLNNIKNPTANLFDGKRTLTAESGSITFENGLEDPLFTGQTASIVLKKQFTNQFIKVSFTALENVNAQATNFQDALGFSIGFRRQTDDVKVALNDWCLSPWTNTNYFYITHTAAHLKAFSSATKVETLIQTKAFNTIEIGEKYSLAFGITQNKAGENVFHVIWLDENDNIISYRMADQEYFDSKWDGVKTLKDSGYFTINVFATEKITLDYQVISEDDAHTLIGAHTYDNYEKVDDSFHALTCDCGASKGNEAHSGGEATYTEKAVCDYCNEEYGNYKQPIADDVELLNTTNETATPSDGKELIDAESGSIKFSSTITSGAFWQNTAVVALKKNYTDEFIKIGFTALSGDGSAVNLHSAMGFAVGFRRTTVVNNPVLADWMFKPNDDTNYGYFYNKAANAFAYGHGGTAIGTMSNLKLVEGEQYYFVLGVTGDAPLEGQEDQRTMYAIWLDADENLIGGFSVSMPKFKSVRPNAAMTDGGWYTIHSYVTELDISYEILSSEERCELLNIHNYSTYTFVDDSYHALTCDCGASKGNETHAGGTATYEERAICSYCNTAYGTVKQRIADDVELLNATNVTATPDTGKELVDTDSGTIKMTSTISSGLSWQNTSVIGLKKNYTDEFIKIGFTALSGDGSKVNLYSAMGFSVGFRRTTVVANPVLADWMFKPNDDTNYGYFYNKAANAFAYGHGGTSIGDRSKLTLVEGEQYYFVLGVTGDAPLEGQEDQRTMYAIWLDAEENLIGGFSVSMSKFKKVRPNGVMTDGGWYTIHSYVSELEVSYEILSSEERCELLGIHNYNTYTFVDDSCHALTCACGASKGNETHAGGTATYEERAVCSYCNTAYGTVKQRIADDVELINMTNVTATPAAGKDVIDTEKGTVTFTSTLTSSVWGGENATVALKKNYTNEFIKVGFTARSGDGTALNASTAMGFGVGFRKQTAASIATSCDWSVVGSDSTMYCVTYGNKAANAFHSGHGYTGRYGNAANLKFVEGQQYYFVVGVVGEAPATGETDNRTMYAIWLDANDNLIAGFSVTMAKFTSVRTDATMQNSGYFTINSFVVGEELTLSYEIIDSATALGYVG